MLPNEKPLVGAVVVIVVDPLPNLRPDCSDAVVLVAGVVVEVEAPNLNVLVSVGFEAAATVDPKPNGVVVVEVAAVLG